MSAVGIAGIHAGVDVKDFPDCSISCDDLAGNGRIVRDRMWLRREAGEEILATVFRRLRVRPSSVVVAMRNNFSAHRRWEIEAWILGGWSPDDLTAFSELRNAISSVEPPFLKNALASARAESSGSTHKHNAGASLRTSGDPVWVICKWPVTCKANLICDALGAGRVAKSVDALDVYRSLNLRQDLAEERRFLLDCFPELWVDRPRP